MPKGELTGGGDGAQLAPKEQQPRGGAQLLVWQSRRRGTSGAGQHRRWACACSCGGRCGSAPGQDAAGPAAAAALWQYADGGHACLVAREG